MTAPDREFDLVLFGATGFTGKLVAEYLSRAGQRRWAIAGRTPSKLDAVRASLVSNQPEILVGDAGSAQDMLAIARRARVVVTTVGPYLKYGDALVAACVEAGTHYCDLTGEVPWMQRTIAAHHDAARRTGARIVHTCGFDSIPSDLGTWFLQRQFGDTPATRVRAYVMYASGGFSGGTVASMAEIMELAKDRNVRRAVADPYALNPADDRSGADGWDAFAPREDAWIGGWTAPFLMASVNTRVVRRTHALLGRPWGPDFSYDEVMYTGKGLKGRAKAFGIAGALGAAVAVLSAGPSRRLAQRYLLPKPGEGPSPEAIENGGFLIRVVGERNGERKAVDVKGTKDPGYGATAIMLAESARCLAYDPLDSPAGVLTPASAMGDALVERLNAAGVTFTVRSSSGR